MTVLNELYALIEKINYNPVHIENESDRVYQIDLETSGTHQIVFKNGEVHAVEGSPNEANVILKISDNNFSKLLKDDLNTMVAFMTGGVKIEGSMGLALKLQEIVRKYQ